MFEGLSDIPQFVCVVLLMAKFSVILLKNSSKKSKASTFVICHLSENAVDAFQSNKGMFLSPFAQCYFSD